MYHLLLRFYFTANVVMLTMLGLSYPFLTPGSPSAVVAQMSLVIIVPSVVLSGGLLYRQAREERSV